MIEVDGLRKQFGDIIAVDGTSFAAQPGKIFGLLGPNGAGKSTTIGCISGLLKPTSGRVAVLGHDVVTVGRAARTQLGIVPQELALYEDLSATENLLFWGAAQKSRTGSVLLSVLSLLQMLATSQRAAALFTNSLMFPLLMIGGSFFPFEMMPHWMAAIGRMTPNGWILVQLKAIVLQKTEIGSFAVATVVLFSIFVVFFGLCVVRLSAVRARG